MARFAFITHHCHSNQRCNSKLPLTFTLNKKKRNRPVFVLHRNQQQGAEMQERKSFDGINLKAMHSPHAVGNTTPIRGKYLSFTIIIIMERIEWFFISFADTPCNSSLPLQMSLFANVYTLPVWVAASAYYFYIHSLGLNDTYERVLALVFFCLATPLEASRLYLGYSGNLRERVHIFI